MRLMTVEPLEKLTEWYEAQGGIDSALSAGFARYEALGDLLPQQKQRINSRWTADQLLTQLQRVLNDGGTAVMVDPLMTIVSATFSDEAKDAFEPIRSYISDRFKGTAKPTQVVIDYLKRRIHQRIEDVWNSAYGEWRAELAKLRPKSCGPDVPTEGGSRK